MNTDSKRIILIEDDEIVRSLVSNLLSNSGNIVVGLASNGSDGLNLIKSVPADVAIIDLGLPDVNGIDLIRIVQNHYSIPVVVLSADEDPDTVRAAGEAGAMLYLVKPLKARELDRAIMVASIRFRHQSELKSINALLEKEVRERKAAEEKILESEFKYRELFETSRDGIAVLDFKDTIQQCNRAFVELCGFSNSEGLVGKNHCDIILNDYHLMYLKIKSDQVVKRGWSDEYEVQYVKNDGTPIFVNLRIWLTRDRTGKPHGMWLFVRDISRLKAAEERILQYEKMEAIGQLAGGVAHDFNNQLGGIVGYADLLSDMLKDHALGAKYVKKILSGAQRATELTTKLLAFARKGKYQLIQVDIHSVITDVIELLEHSIDKTIVLKKSLKASCSIIDGDPEQLHNAILNLSINARDAMPGGGVLEFATEDVFVDMETIRAMYPEISPGKYLKVSVMDSGCGIDDETRKHIFEPFFTTKNLGKGTGLGLAAVYGTVKNHFGAISVHSVKDQGTVFELLMPVTQTKSSVTEYKPADQKNYNGSGSILLIDDDDLVREMTLEMLNKMGYDVIPCKNGIDGIEKYRENMESIDLIIMDMIMPQLNGYETFLRLRAINPEVKALLSSGYSVELHSQRLLGEGAAGLLQKPFTLSELSNKIKNALSTQK